MSVYGALLSVYGALLSVYGALLSVYGALIVCTYGLDRYSERVVFVF